MSTVYGVNYHSPDCHDDNVDLNLSACIQRFASTSTNTNFICYPLGGMRRFNWRPADKDDSTPAIHLPGPLLPCNVWQRSVCGLISPWIDPDDKNVQFSIRSAASLLEELNHANYLLVDTVVLHLRRVCFYKLAAVLRNWLSDHTPKFRIWILLPTAMSALKPAVLASYQDPLADVWAVWRVFHHAVVGDSADDPLEVGLRFCDDSDEEFFDGRLLGRWRGEMLTSIWLSESLFVGDKQSLSLNSFTANCVKRLSDLIDYVIFDVVDESDATVRRVGTQRAALDAIVAHQPRYDSSAADVLQVPLEPLIDNMSNAVYETFERDSVKYEQYGRAIHLALTDIASRLAATVPESNASKPKIVTFVLGAGRGPLVDQLLRQFDAIQNTTAEGQLPPIDLEAWAVEKNPSAVQDLRYFNSGKWKGRVRILHNDFRNLPALLNSGQFERPDLVISELLGSLADNELSPECLYAVEPIFHAQTISIPSSYRSFLVPVQSSVLRQRLLERQRLRETREVMDVGRKRDARIKAMDCLYVSVPKRVHILGVPVQLFEYKHPRECLMHNYGELYFVRQGPCSIVGFSGYFNATLYGDVTLSTVPGEQTPGMHGWAPAFMPLRQPITCTTSRMSVFIKLHVDRKCDASGVWYQWKCDYDEVESGYVSEDESQCDLWDAYTCLDARECKVEQNVNGKSHYIRLK